MAAYKFKTLDDILRYPSPKTTAFKEIWHASQKGFGVRVMRPSKRDGSVRRTYLVRFSDEKGEDVKRNIYRSEEHTSELQSLMRISYAVFCLKKNKTQQT